MWDYLDKEATVYYETDEGNSTFLWKATIDATNRISNYKFESLGPIETNSIVLNSECCMPLYGHMFMCVVDQFIFVEKQLNQSDTTGEGGLFVSYERGDFAEAMFPLKTQEQHYLIADASEQQALVAVYHYDNLTNLYTSDASGHSYSLSLQNLRVRYDEYKPLNIWSTLCRGQTSTPGGRGVLLLSWLRSRVSEGPTSPTD